MRPQLVYECKRADEHADKHGSRCRVSGTLHTNANKCQEALQPHVALILIEAYRGPHTCTYINYKYKYMYMYITVHVR